MSDNSFACYRFDRFTAEPRSARLLCGSEAVAIEPKVLLILLFLLENRHRLVEKQELLDVVWHDAVVTENALTRAVARLRKILGDDPREPRYIETVHSRGYRFLAAVELVEKAAAESGEESPAVQTPSAVAARGGPLPAIAGGAGAYWRVAGAIAGLILLGAITWQRFGRGALPSGEAATEAAAATLDPLRVAALPMVDLSGQSDNAYFVDGLTEQMISTLSRIDGLRVLPRTTVMAYKGTDQRIAEIGRELGAGTVLEGSVRRSGEQLRITVQLVDVAREQTLWSVEFDRPLRDVFAIQSEVAVRVADALQASIAPATLQRIELGPTRVITAWDHYLRGRHFHKQGTRVGVGNAIEQYRRALELDPDFALALAELASANVFAALTLDELPGWPEAAIAAAERALEIDPELPQAYRALGGVAFYQDQFQRAFDLTLKAVELDPDYAAAVYNASAFAQALGRLDQAVLLLLRCGSVRPRHRAILAMDLWELGFEPQARELARQALLDEPLTKYLNLFLARREMLAGELAAARERLQRLGRAYPLLPRVWNLAGLVELRAGQPDAALEYFDKAVETAGGDYPKSELRSAQIRWQRGERAAAQQTLERLAANARHTIEQGSDSRLERWRLAAIEAVRGNPDQALGWLEKAVDLGHYIYQFDQSDPVFESLRDDPRFQQQLERMQAKVAAMRERVVGELGPNLSGLHVSALTRSES